MLVAGKAQAGTDCDRLIGVVDMPFSFVADIMFIPYDIRSAKERPDNQRFSSDEHQGAEQ